MLDYWLVECFPTQLAVSAHLLEPLEDRTAVFRVCIAQHYEP